MKRASFAAGLALATVGGAMLLAAEPAPTREEVCVPHYSLHRRMPLAESERIKRQWMRTQHPGEFMGAYELDHIVPLCLGGSNSLDNLQLQPWPEAKEKDELEAKACRMVCAGEVSIEEARSWFKRTH